MPKLDYLFEDPDVSAEREDDLQEVTPSLLSNSVVWSTDWTASTIVDQLRRGNIALDPVFQRRDAWTDERKSRFIESLFLGLPIPQLVLAETKTKGRFIVIDGKQRLLSLSKFTGVGLSVDQVPLRLRGLALKKELNDQTYESLSSRAKFEGLLAEFDNQPIRTVVIRGWGNDEVLYTIFYRLNTGSVPLSTQELRQALHPGAFLSFAARVSEQSKPIAVLLNLDKPDFRMRDVELVLRFYAFHFRLHEYRGNLKAFLDDTCDLFNKSWKRDSPELKNAAIQMDEAILAAQKIFSRSHTFRKWDGERFERSINRAVFDVVAGSLFDERVRKRAVQRKLEVLEAFKQLCDVPEFRTTIETTTKSKAAVRTRYEMWYDQLGKTLNLDIPVELPA